MAKKALSTRDVYIIFGMPEGTQANIRCRREGPPFFKVGKKVYYKTSEFEEWFFRHRIMTKDAV